MAAPGQTVDEVLLTAVKFAEKEEDDSPPVGYVPDVTTCTVQERSANLYADPKMMELKNYINSHRHEERLRASANLDERIGSGGDSPKASSANTKKAQPKRNLRSDGCKAVDRHIKKLTNEKTTLPRIGACCLELPSQEMTGRSSAGHVDSTRVDKEMLKSLELRQAQLKRMDLFHTRLQWRSGMDFSLRRLLVDLELARDDRLKEYSNEARCAHLDKVFDWYTTCGMKEARKERIPPPYIRYRADGPVMPGSLRATPHYLRERGPGGLGTLGKSASAPNMPGAGRDDGPAPSP